MEGMEADVIDLATSDAVWAKARLLTQRARAKGVAVTVTDLLIAAGACEHGVEREHDGARPIAWAAWYDRDGGPLHEERSDQHRSAGGFQLAAMTNGNARIQFRSLKHPFG